jgi:D-aspartate ligase
MRDRDSVPVLVLGPGITALGVVRILARAGIRAYSLGAGEGVVSRSRWFVPAPGGDGADGNDLVSYLRRTPLERAVLLPCSDSWAMQVARLEPELAARFPSSTASAEAQRVFQDKAEFARLLDSLALPSPRTESIRAPDDLHRVSPEVMSRAFLKPCDSQRFFQRFARKAFRVSGLGDAATKLAEIQREGFEVVLQEYIPGPADSHYYVEGFVDGAGRVRALFARRRLRMYPPDFGNSSATASVPLAEVAGAVETIRTLVSGVGYRGIFSAEFKRDERDGAFKILEVNARAWWYVDFAARCGVDVCTLAYRDALGERLEDVGEYLVGRHCVYPYYDFYACRELWRGGRISPVAWLRSWLGAAQPVFRWNDPLPALGETLRIMGVGVRRRLRRPAPALAKGELRPSRSS